MSHLIENWEQPREVHRPPLDPAAESAGRSLRILVADDDALAAHLVATTLRERGHHVQLATDGAEAVEKARLEHWDLVVMDVDMPVVSGLWATRIIRAHAGRWAPPVVGHSYGADEHQRWLCRAAGMTGFVAKPCGSLDLVSALASASGMAL